MEKNTIKLFNNDTSANAKAPALSGTVYSPEGKPLFDVVAWVNYSQTTGAPYYSGYVTAWKPKGRKEEAPQETNAGTPQDHEEGSKE